MSLFVLIFSHDSQYARLSYLDVWGHDCMFCFVFFIIVALETHWGLEDVL